MTSKLEQALHHLDGRSATLREQLVRDALALVQEANRAGNSVAADALGWPVGHFQTYAGCLVGDDWQPPADPPPDSIPAM